MKRSRVRWKALVLALGLLGVTAKASANGRFPLANQLVIDPENAAHMVARATFGILESDDSGGTWTWICEDAIGYFGIEDPAIAVSADGSTLVASTKGLSTSRDRGCAWITKMGGPVADAGEGRAGIDVTVDPQNPHAALAIESVFSNGIYSVFLLKTTDDGASWMEVGPLPAGTLAETVEVAPSNPDRVYISARMNITSQPTVLLRSDDGGQTWSQSPVDLPAGAAAFIGAVDPRDPDVVYLRARVPANTIGRVLMTRDAGASWTQIWKGAGDVAGFALSGDGSKLAVGGPESGVSVGSTSDLVIDLASHVGASCLTWAGSRLFACGKEAVEGFSIGVSDDDGKTFTSVLHFPDITPRACDASSMAGVCASTWGPIAVSLGIALPDAGVPDDGAPPMMNVDAQGGSGCALRAGRPSRGAELALLAAVGLVRRRRRPRARPLKHQLLP